MSRIRQKFPRLPALDLRGKLESDFEIQRLGSKIAPGSRVAVAVGSRGITNLAKNVSLVVELLKRYGAQPFIVPAMGSHGGATPEGQTEILAGYGITEAALGVPVRSSMEVEQLGRTDDGIDVYFSADARRADGIVVLNRIKPHTDFSGNLGSGILKMLAIGLGKRGGAVSCHAAASRLGHEHVIRTVARFLLRRVPVLCGVAIIENQSHETQDIVVLAPQQMEAREEALLVQAKKLMPQLPFAEIDLLIVDRMGKDISGAGMDPNIIGRSVHGYSSSLLENRHTSPKIHRIFVRDLSPGTHGNAIGIGLADFTTSRVVRGIDPRSTHINALAAVTVQTAKIPIYFDTDQEAVRHGLDSLCLPDAAQAKVVRILDTLSLEHLEVSEAYLDLVRQADNLELMGQPAEMEFDSSGNLAPLAAARERVSKSGKAEGN